MNPSSKNSIVPFDEMELMKRNGWSIVPRRQLLPPRYLKAGATPLLARPPTGDDQVLWILCASLLALDREVWTRTRVEPCFARPREACGPRWNIPAGLFPKMGWAARVFF